MDIILGHPRRKWSVEEKRALVAEAAMPGSSVSSVAHRYGIRTGMLFKWRKQFGEASAGGVPVAPPGFVQAVLSQPLGPPDNPAQINIAFASGARMTLSGSVDPALVSALTKVLARS
jgi:transposase